MSRNIYYDNHTVSVVGDLELSANNVVIDGTLILNDATLADLTITNGLTVSSMLPNASQLIINSTTYGVNISATTGSIALITTDGGIITIQSDDALNIAGDDVIISAADDIILNATDSLVIISDDLQITATTDISLSGQGGDFTFLVDSLGVYISNAAQVGGEYQLLPSSYVEVKSGNQGVYSQVLVVRNEWNDAQADGISIVLEPAVLTPTNTFARFCHSGDLTNVSGRIRGPANATSIPFIADGISTATQVDSTTDCVFASGTADFGEWIELGDIGEWNISDQYMQVIDTNKPYFGLPEGWVCYIRDNKFYKEGSTKPSTPMIVTKRSLIVGNERDNGKDYIGEIFSFAGQVPVIVKGPVKSGDYLIPSGTYYCVGVDPESITFNEYKKVIGTAWEDLPSDKNFGSVSAAIGIKNTY